MIRHIVMWNVRGDTPVEKAQAIERLQNSFESLRGQIPGLLHLEIGVDSSRIDYFNLPTFINDKLVHILIEVVDQEF